MNTIAPILAMHGHFAGRGFLVIMVVAVLAIILLCLPNKSETK